MVKDAQTFLLDVSVVSSEGPYYRVAEKAENSECKIAHIFADFAQHVLTGPWLFGLHEYKCVPTL